LAGHKKREKDALNISVVPVQDMEQN